ncbi:hypothetical protein D3C71_1582120 [compost metagenome]
MLMRNNRILLRNKRISFSVTKLVPPHLDGRRAVRNSWIVWIELIDQKKLQNLPLSLKKVGPAGKQSSKALISRLVTTVRFYLC